MERLRTPRLRLAFLAGSSLLLLLAVLSACSGLRRGSGEEAPRVIERGTASWYGPNFHGRLTANGERYDMHGMTAAHKTLPFGTLLEVRNLDNGRVCRVRVNDRGPFIRGRILDVSRAAATELGMIGPGTARVELAVVEPGAASAPVAAAPASVGPYTVQVGAFSEEVRAATLRDLLGSHYGDVEVRSDGTWHRVQVGRFAQRQAAETLRRELEELGWAALVVAIR